MPDIIALIKTARSLQDFLASDKVLELFADIELDAARQAFENARKAKDPVSQVWGVIGHLESALQAVIRDLQAHALSAAGAFRLYVVPGYAVARHRNLSKGRYILCLLAVCYWYLGESALVEQTMQRALQKWYYDEPEASLGAAILTGLWPIALLVGTLQGPFAKQAEYFTVEHAKAIYISLTGT